MSGSSDPSGGAVRHEPHPRREPAPAGRRRAGSPAATRSAGGTGSRRTGSDGRGTPAARSGAGAALRGPHVLEREVACRARAEHAVHAQRGTRARHVDVGRDLRRVAAVAEHFDVDLDRAGRHRREEDRVRGDERQLRPVERLLHRAQRGVHADAAEDVHDLPAVGDVGVEASRVGRDRASAPCRRGRSRAVVASGRAYAPAMATDPLLRPFPRPSGTTSSRRDTRCRRRAAEHLRDARAPSEADEALARVRQPRARQVDASAARPRAADPAHRLALPRAVRVGAARRDRARGRDHRRRDRARRRRARRRRLGSVRRAAAARGRRAARRRMR